MRKPKRTLALPLSWGDETWSFNPKLAGIIQKPKTWDRWPEEWKRDLNRLGDLIPQLHLMVIGIAAEDLNIKFKDPSEWDADRLARWHERDCPKWVVLKPKTNLINPKYRPEPVIPLGCLHAAFGWVPSKTCGLWHPLVPGSGHCAEPIPHLKPYFQLWAFLSGDDSHA